MKCHYIYDPEVGKVLIPGCMSTAAIGIASCTCRPRHLKKEPHPNDKLVKELEAENARLNRIIKRLLSNANASRNTKADRSTVPDCQPAATEDSGS